MSPLFVDIHTHSAKASDNLLQIVNLDLEQERPEQGYFSYGIHPWLLDNTGFQVDATLKKLEDLLQQPHVLALGEAGLDKMHKNRFEQQIILFERQIELSETLHKPMILHDVKSHNEILALRKKHKARQPWILHGFNGTEQDIQQLTGQGLYLSVGEALLHSDRKIYKSFKEEMADVGLKAALESLVRKGVITLEEVNTLLEKCHLSLNGEYEKMIAELEKKTERQKAIFEPYDKQYNSLAEGK